MITGNWAKKAFQEAQILGDAHRPWPPRADRNFFLHPRLLPTCPSARDASYLYICENNTIYGTKFPELPNTKGHVLVADQSSMFLSEPVDVTRYGLIHAPACRRTWAPAGVQIVIVREDLIPRRPSPACRTMLRLRTQADAGSLYNTRPTAGGIYVCGLVFKWIERMGGLAAMGERNAEKGPAPLYDYLDESALFSSTVDRVLPLAHERALRHRATRTSTRSSWPRRPKRGLVSLKGHRSVGGMRRVPSTTPCRAPAWRRSSAFMKDFEMRHAR